MTSRCTRWPSRCWHAWLQRKAHRHGRALEATQRALRERERGLADAQDLNVSGEAVCHR